MNLFRSEEHVRNWDRFDATTEQGIVQLDELVALFSGSLFKRRLDGDYVTHSQEYTGELLNALAEIAEKSPFWAPPEES